MAFPLIKDIESIDDVGSGDERIGAENAVPNGKYIAIIAVCQGLLVMMMDTVHGRRDQEEPQYPVYLLRNTDVGVIEL